MHTVGLCVVATPEAHALLKEVDRVYVGLESIGAAAERIRTMGVEGLRIAAGVHAIAFEPAIQFDCHVIRPRQQPEQALVADFLQALRIVARESENAAKKRINRSRA